MFFLQLIIGLMRISIHFEDKYARWPRSRTALFFCLIIKFLRQLKLSWSKNKQTRVREPFNLITNKFIILNEIRMVIAETGHRGVFIALTVVPFRDLFAYL